MTVTNSVIVKGAGGLCLKQIATGRLLYLSLNSKITFTKSEQAGDAVTGVNSDGNQVTLSQAGSTLTYELEVNSKKNTRNMNEMILNAEYVPKTGYEFPHAEVQTIAAGAITLAGSDAPVAGKTKVTQLDTGTMFTPTGSAPSAGEFKDNGDGTITFNTADNGKQVVIGYYQTQDVSVQGGADNTAPGDMEVFFHQVSGTSDVSGSKGVDILWLPKCSISGDVSLDFSSDVNDKTFKLTANIPDTPSGWTVPYAIIRGAELDNSNAG